MPCATVQPCATASPGPLHHAVGASATHDRDRHLAAAASLPAVPRAAAAAGRRALRQGAAAQVVGGQQAAKGQFPYAALLSMQECGSSAGPLSTSYCGGSLIAPRVVLSAAHCAQPCAARFAGLPGEAQSGAGTSYQWPPMALELNRWDRTAAAEPGGEARAVAAVLRHPDFLLGDDDTPLRHDLMLLRLNASSAVEPVRLAAEPAFPAGQEFQVAGWGYVNQDAAIMPAVIRCAAGGGARRTVGLGGVGRRRALHWRCCAWNRRRHKGAHGACQLCQSSQHFSPSLTPARTAPAAPQDRQRAVRQAIDLLLAVRLRHLGGQRVRRRAGAHLPGHVLWRLGRAAGRKRAATSRQPPPGERAEARWFPSGCQQQRRRRRRRAPHGQSIFFFLLPLPTVQAGVTSYGHYGCGDMYPGVYVNAPAQAAWLDDAVTLHNMGGAEAPGVQCASRVGHRYHMPRNRTLAGIPAAGECCNACKVSSAPAPGGAAAPCRHWAWSAADRTCVLGAALGARAVAARWTSGNLTRLPGRPAGQCQVEYYVKYGGPPLRSAPAADVGACCAACRGLAGCRAFTFELATQACALLPAPGGTGGWARQAWQYGYLSGLVPLDDRPPPPRRRPPPPRRRPPPPRRRRPPPPRRRRPPPPRRG
jgi:hypothetical protein